VASKYIRSVTKILKASSGVLFGRKTTGTGKAEELTPSDVRALLSVYTISQTDAAISTAVNALVGGAPGLLDTLDELSAALGDDANFASTVTTALAGKVDSSSLNESIDDRVAALLVAGTNITLTYNDASGSLTIASTGSGLSGTGSVDNAVLRADGTGGATLQSSAVVIDDLFTASPNNTVNFTCLKPTGGTTNVGVAIVPKGTGAFSLAVPDGTATGGNARGANAVDLQTLRNAATAVGTGLSSFTAGQNNTNAGTYGSISGGTANATTAVNSPCVTGGNSNTASADMARAGGFYCVADQYGMDAWSSGGFANFGASADVRIYRQMLKQKTTNATPVRLQANGINQTAIYTLIPSGRVLLALIKISGVKSDGSACAEYLRKVAIKNVSGTTSLVGSVETIGTDIEDNASTDVSITADNTNDAVNITVTGIAAETWRWVAVVEGLEIAYGT
jgi:hypothetical protein